MRVESTLAQKQARAILVAFNLGRVSGFTEEEMVEHIEMALFEYRKAELSKVKSEIIERVNNISDESFDKRDIRIIISTTN